MWWGREQGWVQIHMLGSDTNTTWPNQIQIHCFSRLQFKYNYKHTFLIQTHCHFLFKYNSITLPFLKFDSNMIKIRVSIIVQVYHSGWSFDFSLIDCCRLIDRQFY